MKFKTIEYRFGQNSLNKVGSEASLDKATAHDQPGFPEAKYEVWGFVAIRLEWREAEPADLHVNRLVRAAFRCLWRWALTPDKSGRRTSSLAALSLRSTLFLATDNGQKEKADTRSAFSFWLRMLGSEVEND